MNKALQPLPAVIHSRFRPAGRLTLIPARQLDLSLRKQGIAIRRFCYLYKGPEHHPSLSWSLCLAQKSCSSLSRSLSCTAVPSFPPGWDVQAGISFMHLLWHHCCQSSPGFRRGEHDRLSGRWWSHHTSGEDHLILTFLQERKTPVS